MSNLQLKYFVLKPKGNNIYAEASRIAIQAYAYHVWDEDPELREGLLEWVRNETATPTVGENNVQ